MVFLVAGSGHLEENEFKASCEANHWFTAHQYRFVAGSYVVIMSNVLVNNGKKQWDRGCQEMLQITAFKIKKHCFSLSFYFSLFWMKRRRRRSKGRGLGHTFSILAWCMFRVRGLRNVSTIVIVILQYNCDYDYDDDNNNDEDVISALQYKHHYIDVDYVLFHFN
ncbi:hypothetical protein M0802_008135 [Mischocyttarus mexicanus]|nr:hypothetical protein M0802_008135 [Mischocyttarus mexicanus]